MERSPRVAGRVHLAPVSRDGGRQTAGPVAGEGKTADIPRQLRRDSAFQTLLLATLWVAAHPYWGIVHDARFYTVQALNTLEPERFAGDLYFAFGSQDAFTLFSGLYAPLVGSLGPSAAHRLATTLGHVCWFAALLCLVRSMFHGHAAVLAAAAVIAAGPGYGHLQGFSYGEPFATPRLFAEAAVIAALALALRGRLVAAALCLAGAASLHPLMAVPGIGVLAVLLMSSDRRFWLLCAVLAGGGAALATAGLEPFSRALMVFDNDWFATVVKRCAFAFVSSWTWMDFLSVTPAIVVVAVAGKLAGADERRFLVAAAVVAAGGVFATAIGADAARNVLAVNLQPWRALWVLDVVAYAWAAALALRLPPASATRGFFSLGLACGAAEQWADLPSIASPFAFGTALVCFALERRAASPLSGASRLAACAVAAPIVAHLVTVLWLAAPRRAEVDGAASVAAAAVATLALLGALVLSTAPRWKTTPAAWGAGVALLVGASAFSDRRTESQSFKESEAVPAGLLDFVEDAGTVYWEKGVELLWFKLRRTSHYSCLQGTGAMFFAATAREYQRRTDALSGLNTADFDDEEGGLCALKQASGDVGPADRAQLESACRALPELDTLVLTKRVEGVRSESWQAPVRLLIRQEAGMPVHHDTFHKYRCSDLR